MPVATERGGAEATLLQLLEHAPRDVRWRVIFLEPGPMTGRVEALGAEATVLPAGRVRQLGTLLATTRRLGAVLRNWRADAVISWMSKAHLYTAPASAPLRLPNAWFQHGLPSPTDPMDRLVRLLPTGAVLTPSRTVAEAQTRLWPRWPTRVAYPGIDLAGEPAATGASPRAELDALGVPPDGQVVGLVARLQGWKGIHVLVAALPQVLERHPLVHLVVVGGDHPLEPGYREQLEQLAERLGVRDRLHLAGYQPDARRWMAGFDVVVHASDVEPFGLVVLEAMAVGKPLIAGDQGGPAEIIRHGVEGFLVPFGDSSGLAGRIADYLGDPELGRRTGEAAARRAREFSPDRFARDVVQTIRVLTGADPPAAPGVPAPRSRRAAHGGR